MKAPPSPRIPGNMWLIYDELFDEETDLEASTRELAGRKRRIAGRPMRRQR